MCQKQFERITQLSSCPRNPFKKVSRNDLNPSDLDLSGQIRNFFSWSNPTPTFLPILHFKMVGGQSLHASLSKFCYNITSVVDPEWFFPDSDPDPDPDPNFQVGLVSDMNFF